MTPLIRAAVIVPIVLMMLACGPLLGTTGPPSGPSIAVDESREGSLGWRNRRSLRDGVPVTFHDLDASGDTPVEIRAVSDHYGPHLALFTAGGEFLSARDSEGTREAVMQVLPGEDRLRIVVGAQSPEDSGDFALHVTALDQTRTPGETLTVPGRFTGFLHRGSPELRTGDLAPTGDLHPLQIEAPTPVTITLEAAIPLPHPLKALRLHLRTPDGATLQSSEVEDGRATVTAELQPGAYEVVVQQPHHHRGGEGLYELTLEAAAEAP